MKFFITRAFNENFWETFLKFQEEQDEKDPNTPITEGLVREAIAAYIDYNNSQNKNYELISEFETFLNKMGYTFEDQKSKKEKATGNLEEVLQNFIKMVKEKNKNK